MLSECTTQLQQARELGLQCGLRPPTYTTAGGAGGGAGIVKPAFGHASTIVSTVVIPNADGVGVSEMLSLGESDSFQVSGMESYSKVVFRVHFLAHDHSRILMCVVSLSGTDGVQNGNLTAFYSLELPKVGFISSVRTRFALLLFAFSSRWLR